MTPQNTQALKRLLLTAFMTSLTGVPSAFALEDHATTAGVFNWIPNPQTLNAHPEVNSYKDFYIHEIKFDKQNDGTFKMSILLPEDLSAGKKLVVSLNETSRQLPDDPDSGDNTTFKFASNNGTATCYAGTSWNQGSCSRIDFYNLPTPRADATTFIAKKYKDTDRAPPLGTIAYYFSAEPFGSISFSDTDSLLEGSALGNGRWKSRYQAANGQWIDAPMNIDFYRGTYMVGTSAGLLGGLYYTDDVVEGGWNFKGSFGWFRFKFIDRRFVGEWGIYENDAQVIKGRWDGERI